MGLVLSRYRYSEIAPAAQIYTAKIVDPFSVTDQTTKHILVCAIITSVDERNVNITTFPFGFRHYSNEITSVTALGGEPTHGASRI